MGAAEQREELEQLVDRYRRFIELSAEGIWCFEFEPPVPLSLDVDDHIALCLERGRMTECNDALARMYGYGCASDLLNLPLSQFLRPDDPANCEYLQAFVRNGMRLEDGESHEVDRHGRTRTFLNNLVGVTRDGMLLRVWGTQRDVTERKRLQDQLQQAQKMEALGQMAGGIAHDLNNMLTVIHGNVSIAMNEASEVLLDPLLSARHAAEQAAGLTRKLLTFSQRSPIRSELLDLNRVVRATVSMLRPVIPAAIELEVETDESLPTVRADPVEIEQVLVNLLVNARDSMPGEGRLWIRTRTLDAAGGASTRAVVLEVADTGSGIRPDDLPHIFEPFYTTKGGGGGTGLGLSMVYGIATKLGGRVTVQSRVAEGTTFAVTLPGVAGELRRTERRRADSSVALGRSVTVLLVEDQEDVRRLTRALLEAAGHSVLCACDANQAFEVSGVHAGQVDLLLTDVVMPGMNGVELARQLRRLRPDMPVLFMSGYPEFEEELNDDPVLDAEFLAKPFTHHELAGAVASTLHRSASRVPLP